MGADLCGYIFVGPAVLGKRRLAAATRRVRRLVTQAQELVQLYADGREPDPDQPECQEVYEYGSGLGIEDLSAAAERLAKLDVGVFVAQVADMWHDGYRDSMSRFMPDNRHRRIVVCGERTWGDGPEPDSAWGTAQELCALGLQSCLDLE